MGRKRIRAHANPNALSDIAPPNYPEEFNWSEYYPSWFPESADGQKPEVTIADIGCGFGGLLHTLSPMFPEKLIVGIEIRPSVVSIVENTIEEAREKHKMVEAKGADGSPIPSPYNNIAVLRSNMMKYVPNYFRKGQLEKMFFLFPDPHFKRSKYRLRIINPIFLDYYAYAIREGGILYTITDVKDLHVWMKQHLDEHPLFERIPDEEMASDPCFDAIHMGTHEGQKVTRNHGDKWPACYRRIAYKGPIDGKARINILE